MKHYDFIYGDYVWADGKVATYEGHCMTQCPYRDESKQYKRMLCMFDAVNGTWIPEDDVKPIRLTEDILILNGFESYKYTTHTTYDLGDVFNIVLDHGTFFAQVCSNNCVVTYVHELQHLLWVCGLGQIARSLKLTKNVQL